MTARRVGVLVFEGFEELDAVGPYDVFGSAADRGANWTVELLATGPTDRVTGANGLRVEPDATLSVDGNPAATADGNRMSAVKGDRKRAAAQGDATGTEGGFDSLLVPGGGWNDRAGAGARAVAEDERVLTALRDLHEGGTTLFAVCTGGMILSAAGLLDGRAAVTHRGALAELRETDAEVVEARVVDDGDVVTSGGVTAGIDLALWVVEREWGTEVADAVATEMEYERSPDVYRAGDATDG
ncbi:AraC family transcriptional regulator [Halobacteriales archaeon QS_4_69_31]|nr:MAG: AraC family transcriptional regulator [Halobacteriales archaeon QS_4_69_31]